MCKPGAGTILKVLLHHTVWYCGIMRFDSYKHMGVPLRIRKKAAHLCAVRKNVRFCTRSCTAPNVNKSLERSPRTYILSHWNRFLLIGSDRTSSTGAEKQKSDRGSSSSTLLKTKKAIFFLPVLLLEMFPYVLFGKNQHLWDCMWPQELHSLQSSDDQKCVLVNYFKMLGNMSNVLYLQLGQHCSKTRSRITNTKLYFHRYDIIPQ